MHGVGALDRRGMLAGDGQRGVQALEAVDALRPDCGAQRQPRVLVGGIQRGRVAACALDDTHVGVMSRHPV